MESTYLIIIVLIIGFIMDQLFGDPEKLPHLIAGFGNIISFFEKKCNNGHYLIFKGALMVSILVITTYLTSYFFIELIHKQSLIIEIVTSSILIFYCLSAKTLRSEVQQVFTAVELSLESGRKQLSRIVGRDTQGLSEQQIRSAALETLAENLSDGVIAPLFWYALLGIPGMLSYKMINTLDSMIGYKNERYIHFGKFAARLDDVANYIPARITALIMLISSAKLSQSSFVYQQGKNHTSPNSGYPEAALAALLNCRFGGPNYYFGTLMHKPYIGVNNRELNKGDLHKALYINRFSEVAMLICVLLYIFIIHSKH